VGMRRAALPSCLRIRRAEPLSSLIDILRDGCTSCADSRLEDILMTTVSGHTSAIRAKRVIGTDVSNPAGDKIGQVEDLVLDKLSNHIMFAIVSFGGFLGMGQKYHPIPWSSLEYDSEEGGYIVDFTKEQLQAAPSDTIEELTRNDGLAYREKVYDYYRAPRYWE
jgi:sporulation protein YlmC with PRC-barrel domain